MFAVSPLLLVTFIPLIVCRLALSSRRSKRRIALLEKDESAGEALVRALVAAEKRVEDAMIDAVDTLGNSSDSAPRALPSTSQGTLTGSSSPMLNVDGTEVKKTGTGAKGAFAPELLPAQHTMIARLNALPNLVKRLVYIHPTRNSHATIVARDVQQFSFHKNGWGVIRHWADGFVV